MIQRKAEQKHASVPIYFRTTGKDITLPWGAAKGNHTGKNTTDKRDLCR